MLFLKPADENINYYFLFQHKSSFLLFGEVKLMLSTANLYLKLRRFWVFFN